MRPRLVMFVRAPALGRGKRRLAREIGDLSALRFERLMIARLLRLLDDPRWELRLAVAPDRAHRQARRWHRRVEICRQGEGDLGRRMRRVLAAAPPGPVVLVGGDIPAIDANHVATALRRLGAHDLVFGPAADGGFWLVGSRRRPLPFDLFARVRWSGPHALADTLAGLSPRITLGFVDTLEDVDDGQSYRRLKSRHRF
jgi:uncharacterized protein